MTAIKLTAPADSLDFSTYDIHKVEINLSDYLGKAVILSFFRDTSCPFCLKRVFDLSAQQNRWRKLGVEIIVVFTSPPDEVASFHKNKFERLRVIGDPELKIYNLYGIEKSVSGFFKGLALKLPTIAQGVKRGAKIDKNNPHGTIIPADFLIDPDGLIVDCWYGRNAGDNIPIQRIHDFVKKMSIQNRENSSES